MNAGLKGRKKLQLHRTISLQSVFGGPKTWVKNVTFLNPHGVYADHFVLSLP